LLVVFKFRILERITIVVITAGHVEAFPCCGTRPAPPSAELPPFRDGLAFAKSRSASCLLP
jgi:hypothetical protein